MCFKTWNKANVVTFFGIICSVIGISFGFKGKTEYSLILLIIAGICDAFDGTVARLNKDCSKDEGYGIQIDSLADIICSGIFPVIICISMGFSRIVDIIVYSLFIIAGIIRLTYFNVNTKQNKNYFQGVPITVSTMILPILYVLTRSEIAFILSMLILSILFVSNIKIKKPNTKVKILLSIIGIILIIFIIRSI